MDAQDGQDKAIFSSRLGDSAVQTSSVAVKPRWDLVWIANVGVFAPGFYRAEARRRREEEVLDFVYVEAVGFRSGGG